MTLSRLILPRKSHSISESDCLGEKEICHPPPYTTTLVAQPLEKQLQTALFSAEFVADTVYDDVMNPMSFSKIAPPMSLTHPAFFEEWYYYFKRNLASHSEVFQAYLLTELTVSAPRLIGSRDQIRRARNEITRTFSTAIKRHLGPDHMSFFLGRTVDRQYAEIVMKADMAALSPESELRRILRYNQLRAKAKKGDMSPYVNHLIATGVDDQEVWLQVMQLLLYKRPSERKLCAVQREVQKQQQSQAPIMDRVQNLLESLRRQRLFKRVKPFEAF